MLAGSFSGGTGETACPLVGNMPTLAGTVGLGTVCGAASAGPGAQTAMPRPSAVATAAPATAVRARRAQADDSKLLTLSELRSSCPPTELAVGFGREDALRF